MELNLQRPLIIFDLETTGLDIAKDRIIQISYIKVWQDGREQRTDYLVNPERKIGEMVSALTGITDADVADKPTFRQLAAILKAEFEGCDFAGYNSNSYDIPLLAEEFIRAGVDFDFAKAHLVDVQAIFRKMERRNLAAAYKFYCGRKMEDDFEAHRADQDTEATYRVLKAQLDRYSPENEPETNRHLQNDIAALANFSRDNNNVDFSGRIIWAEKRDEQGRIVMGNDGKPVMVETFNFGKHKGKSVEWVLSREPSYFNWMMQGDFTNNTKQALTRIQLRMRK